MSPNEVSDLAVALSTIAVSANLPMKIAADWSSPLAAGGIGAGVGGLGGLITSIAKGKNLKETLTNTGLGAAAGGAAGFGGKLLLDQAGVTGTPAPGISKAPPTAGGKGFIRMGDDGQMHVTDPSGKFLSYAGKPGQNAQIRQVLDHDPGFSDAWSHKGDHAMAGAVGAGAGTGAVGAVHLTSKAISDILNSSNARKAVMRDVTGLKDKGFVADHLRKIPDGSRKSLANILSPKPIWTGGNPLTKPLDKSRVEQFIENDPKLKGVLSGSERLPSGDPLESAQGQHMKTVNDLQIAEKRLAALKAMGGKVGPATLEAAQHRVDRLRGESQNFKTTLRSDITNKLNPVAKGAPPSRGKGLPIGRGSYMTGGALGALGSGILSVYNHNIKDQDSANAFYNAADRDDFYSSAK
jgi:hypothetical protein